MVFSGSAMEAGGTIFISIGFPLFSEETKSDFVPKVLLQESSTCIKDHILQYFDAFYLQIMFLGGMK